jgi:hypothetical protein
MDLNGESLNSNVPKKFITEIILERSKHIIKCTTYLNLIYIYKLILFFYELN